MCVLVDEQIQRQGCPNEPLTTRRPRVETKWLPSSSSRNKDISCGSLGTIGRSTASRPATTEAPVERSCYESGWVIRTCTSTHTHTAHGPTPNRFQTVGIDDDTPRYSLQPIPTLSLASETAPQSYVPLSPALGAGQTMEEAQQEIPGAPDELIGSTRSQAQAKDGGLNACSDGTQSGSEVDRCFRDSGCWSNRSRDRSQTSQLLSFTKEVPYVTKHLGPRVKTLARTDQVMVGYRTWMFPGGRVRSLLVVVGCRLVRNYSIG
jgi:hypothetical protein